MQELLLQSRQQRMVGRGVVLGEMDEQQRIVQQI